MTLTPTPRRPQVARPSGLDLGRSPFDPRIITRGILAGLALAAIATAVGWALTALPVMALEVTLFESAYISEPGWLFVVALVLGYLGHSLVVAPAAVAVSLLAYRRWGSWDLGLLLVVVLGGATAVTGVVKLATDRARPDEALISTLSSAFPSGHAVRAVAVYGLVAWLLLNLTRHRGLRQTVLPVTVAVVVLNGIARVALGAHWPSDVLAGFAIGGAWLLMSMALIRPELHVEPEVVDAHEADDRSMPEQR